MTDTTHGSDSDSTVSYGPGDRCPFCKTGILRKQPATKPQCPNCQYVHGSDLQERSLNDFPVSLRQGRHLLSVLDGTPFVTDGVGDVEQRLRHYAAKRNVDVRSLKRLLADVAGDLDKFGGHHTRPSIQSLNPRVQGNVDYPDLLGAECPECGEEMDAGNLRHNGRYWQHKSSDTHAQAGHHTFDAVDAADQLGCTS